MMNVLQLCVFALCTYEICGLETTVLLVSIYSVFNKIIETDMRRCLVLVKICGFSALKVVIDDEVAIEMFLRTESSMGSDNYPMKMSTIAVL
jgi:hypothetical protein